MSEEMENQEEAGMTTFYNRIKEKVKVSGRLDTESTQSSVTTDRRGFLKIMGFFSAAALFPYSELIDSRNENGFFSDVAAQSDSHQLNLSGGSGSNPQNYYLKGINVSSDSGTVLGSAGIGVLEGETHSYSVSALDDLRVEGDIVITDGDGNQISSDQAVQQMCKE